MAALLILLGCAGIALVLRHSSDAAYVSWGIVLLAVNLWISESTKRRRALEAGGIHQTGAGHGGFTSV